MVLLFSAVILIYHFQTSTVIIHVSVDHCTLLSMGCLYQNIEATDLAFLAHLSYAQDKL